MDALPISRPYFGAEELEAVQAPLRSGWVVQDPAARVAALLSLALPFFPGMSDADLDRVAGALRRQGAG